MGYIVKNKKWCIFYAKSIKDVGFHFSGDIDEARFFNNKKNALLFLEEKMSNLRCYKDLQVIKYSKSKERN